MHCYTFLHSIFNIFLKHIQNGFREMIECTNEARTLLENLFFVHPLLYLDENSVKLTISSNTILHFDSSFNAWVSL